MALKLYKPITPGMRLSSRLDNSALSSDRPQKGLVRLLPKRSGRNASGKVTVRHQGGRHKRYYRQIDFHRNKFNIPAKIGNIEYDPNRSANIALLIYQDGEKRYILAPAGLKINDVVMSGSNADIKPGNALPLAQIPVGTSVHCVELQPKQGAKLVRGAGVAAYIIARENGWAQVKFPSGEIRRISGKSLATIGQVGNEEWRNVEIGKAGRSRRMGIRPSVRGVAQNPRTHPHGGGEGRSGIGMKSPKSPWGKRTLGKKTRSKGKYSDQYIIQRNK